VNQTDMVRHIDMINERVSTNNSAYEN
jgi:hypothetical protein